MVALITYTEWRLVPYCRNLRAPVIHSPSFKERTMQRWEYLYVVAMKTKQDWSGPRRVYSVNGSELSGWDTGPNLPDRFNAWGREG